MLVPLNFAVWYGEAMAASIVAEFSSVVTADIAGYARGGSAIVGVGSIPFAKPTRLVNSPVVIVASGSVTQALPKGRARPTATIRVNALSQDDVSGAVLESPVEPGVSLKEAIRIILASQAGKVAISGATVTIRDVGDNKARITATTDTNGQRTAVTVDASDV